MWVDNDKPWNRFIKRDGAETAVDIGGAGMGGKAGISFPIPNRTRVLYPQSVSLNKTGNPSQLV